MKTILIAEDDDTNYLILSKFIQKNREVEIERVINGFEVIEKITLNADKYSCILMDIKMPLLNGLETSKRLREAGFSIPIIAVTAAAMFGDREKAISAGINAYLTKPINYSQLFKLLDDVESGDL